MMISVFNFAHFLQNYLSDLFCFLVLPVLKFISNILNILIVRYLDKVKDS